MRRLYCTWAVLVALAAQGGVAAQQPASTVAPASAGYTIFLRGAPVGREDVTIQTGADGTTISSQARLSAPFNSITRLAEFRYGPDWSPQSFSLDATIGGAPVNLRTTFKGGTATTEGTQGGKPISASHQVAAQTIVLPNGIFAGYMALALRLAASPAAELQIYVLPVVEIAVRVNAIHREQIQVGATVHDVRRYDLTFANPGGDLAATLVTSASGSLIRLNVAAQGLDMVRDDVAASTARTQVHSNAGDEPVTIPVAGFNLGATLTRPKSGPARLPAVVLLSASGVGDRDGFALGIPTQGQLAGAIAEAGMLALRYDKRGYGQSGGRSESATITDYAEDARAVVRWLAERKDVDPNRIAVVGHGDGAWVAFLAAARERRRVAAVVSIAAPSAPGSEWNLEQQQLALERSALPPSERDTRIALQKQIQAAALTGKGWEGIPAELREQADTPWFQSFLRYDPADVLEDVRQPLLFVHGALDRQVPVAHVERLADIARTKSDSKAVEVAVVRGVNHLLVAALTGEVSEYAALTDRTVSADASSAITSWLTRTFAAIR